jgi:glycosyltransferase involved in cell wall biosynthesis
MNITIIQGAFFPVPALMGGAVEKIWFRLGQEFARLGHSVTHISRCHPKLPNREFVDGVNYLRVPGYSQPANVAGLKLLDFLYSLRACSVVPLNSDVIVTNTFWSPWLIRKCLRRKVYLDVQRVPKGQMKWYSSAGRLRACSPAIAEAIYRELPAERHSQVSFIANPIPFDAPSDNLRAHKINQILYCGRVHPEKGMEILIDACSELPWPTIAVGPQEYIHGGGGIEYAQSLQHKSNQKSANITFIPPVFDPEILNDFYNRSAIFVYPSIAERGEAAPVAPREAMAWGCVPVVSDLECFKDIIRHEKNGLIFNHRAADPGRELSAALQRLIADKELWSRLSTEAIKICRTHAPGKIARSFLADFETMIASQRNINAIRK